MKHETNKLQREKVTLKHHTYQPSKAELEADIRIPNATFERGVQALTRPVEIRHERKR